MGAVHDETWSLGTLEHDISFSVNEAETVNEITGVERDLHLFPCVFTRYGGIDLALFGVVGINDGPVFFE